MENTFSDIYPKLKPAVVAIVSSLSSNPDFPDIIGTGFIVRPDGVIITNNHVIEAIKKLPRRKSMRKDEWPIKVMFFHFLPDKGMAPIPLEVKGIDELRREKPIEGFHYGEEIPDLGFIKVDIKDLPSLEISPALNLNEGDEVMVSGFPMGTDTLKAPGYIHQLSPTLQRGILSTVLPFPCSNPHAILLDLMVQGGSSGSPVLDPSNGKVVGIVYAGITEPKIVSLNGSRVVIKSNTSMTLAIPAKIIYEICQMLFKEKLNDSDPSKFDNIDSLIARKGLRLHKPKTPTLEAVDPADLVNPI